MSFQIFILICRHSPRRCVFYLIDDRFMISGDIKVLHIIEGMRPQRNSSYFSAEMCVPKRGSTLIRAHTLTFTHSHKHTNSQTRTSAFDHEDTTQKLQESSERHTHTNTHMYLIIVGTFHPVLINTTTVYMFLTLTASSLVSSQVGSEVKLGSPSSSSGDISVASLTSLT